MKSTTHDNMEGTEVTFHYNGDCSGDVEIISDGHQIVVPLALVEEFVLDRFREQAIEAFESASYEDLKEKILW